PHASPFIAEAARPLFRQSRPGLWTLPLPYNGHTYDLYYTETGEPHLISLENLPSTTLTALGSHLNTDQRDIFPHGINLNHVRLINSTTIHVTTYERGVNRITPACGTGSTSSAVLCHRLHTVTTPTIQVQTAGGTLYIDHDADHNRSILKGPATLCPTPRHVVPPDQATPNPKP
ncbi:hypothetical protein GF339_17720, partial [candidate division KSB3 bacterium]|nr:hypothetical protein [candidate division KSB3 bacterium]MBD3326428.1 hypothetical protein [candidate division KSB3 bacterium]